LEQAIALYNPEQHPEITINTSDPRVDCLSFVSWAWWLLGYPDQALKRSHEALALAREQSRPLMRSMALGCAAMLHLFRREGQLVRELAEETRTLSTEQGAPYWVAVGTLTRGGALSLQEQEEEGIPQLRQGLAALRAMGAEMGLTWHLALLAEAYGKEGKPEEGLSKLSEAITLVNRAGERCYEAELYRLKGTLTLQSKVRGQKSKVEEEAEECFLKAIGISRKQQAKSLELRATVSLAKLWQQQGKRTEAHRMLADIYNWFTEGFDTKDLQEAKALLDEVA